MPPVLRAFRARGRLLWPGCGPEPTVLVTLGELYPPGCRPEPTVLVTLEVALFGRENRLAAS